MANSPVLGFTELAEDETVPEDAVNAIARYVEQGALFFGNVASRTTTAEPGSPTDGDCYIVPASATGTNWSGQDGKVAFYMGTAWKFIAPSEGMHAFVADEDVPVLYSGSAWAEARGYDIPMSYAGGPPTSSEILYAFVAVRTIQLPADFAGARGYIGTNPTSSFVINVNDDGATIGTITISTVGAFTFATTSNTAKTIAAGSRVEFVAPGTADATAAYILATLKGFY